MNRDTETGVEYWSKMVILRRCNCEEAKVLFLNSFRSSKVKRTFGRYNILQVDGNLVVQHSFESVAVPLNVYHPLISGNDDRGWLKSRSSVLVNSQYTHYCKIWKESTVSESSLLRYFVILSDQLGFLDSIYYVTIKFDDLKPNLFEIVNSISFLYLCQWYNQFLNEVK